jgi:nitrogen fixation-related uncharacterized protein
MKLWSYGFTFISSSIGVTLIAWVLSLTPAFLRFSVYGVAIIILFVGLGFFLDDWFCDQLDLEIKTWYVILISSSIAFLLGIAVLMGVLHYGA